MTLREFLRESEHVTCPLIAGAPLSSDQAVQSFPDTMLDAKVRIVTLQDGSQAAYQQCRDVLLATTEETSDMMALNRSVHHRPRWKGVRGR